MNGNNIMAVAPAKVQIQGRAGASGNRSLRFQAMDSLSSREKNGFADFMGSETKGKVTEDKHFSKEDVSKVKEEIIKDEAATDSLAVGAVGEQTSTLPHDDHKTASTEENAESLASAEEVTEPNQGGTFAQSVMTEAATEAEAMAARFIAAAKPTPAEGSHLQTILPAAGDDASLSRDMLSALTGQGYRGEIQANSQTDRAATPALKQNLVSLQNLGLGEMQVTNQAASGGQPSMLSAFPQNSALMQFNANVTLMEEELLPQGYGALMTEELEGAPVSLANELFSATETNLPPGAGQNSPLNLGEAIPLMPQDEVIAEEPLMPAAEFTPADKVLTSTGQSKVAEELPGLNALARDILPKQEDAPRSANAQGQSQVSLSPESENRATLTGLTAVANSSQTADEGREQNPGRALQQQMSQPPSNLAAERGATSPSAVMERAAVPMEPSQQNSQAPLTFQQALQNESNVSETSQPQQAGQTRDIYDINRQIVEQARLIRTEDSTQMVIRLRPEHLGDLTLRISVSAEGAVNASFHSDSAYVRTIIDNSLALLRHELNNQGIKVDNVQVSSQLPDGEMPESQNQNAWAEAQNQNHEHSNHNGQGSAARNLRTDGAAYEETGEATALGVNVAPDGSILSGGVDYRI